ncbi:MAG: cytochrome c [Rhodobiaceae bacterium]|nr:cytochrome c [Rhodobiaceae bacterium]
MDRNAGSARSSGLLAGLAALALLAAGPVFAQDTEPEGNPESGKELAAINCSRCHAIGDDDESELPAAPPFRDIMKNYKASMLEEALAEGIVTGHAGMPEFVFSTEEVADMVAYLAQFED